MKNKITKRLVLTSFSIITITLFSFSIITIYNLNSQAMQQAEQLIISENIIMIERTVNIEKVYNNLQPPNDAAPISPFFENQSQLYLSIIQDGDESIHIFCGYDEALGILVFPEIDEELTDNIIFNDIVIEDISNVPLNEPTTVIMNNEKYLVLVAPYQADSNSMFVVSILELDGFTSLQTSNIIQFIIVFAGLIIISFLLVLWQSLKITAPLKSLILRSEEYANHDFSKPFTINTGDEIESLSVSIERMVENIVSYEKAQLLLFRNLSHELKTPLTAISGYAQNIQNGYYEDESIPLTIIQDECKRIRDILDNLIFLNKINSNVETFTFQQTDLVSLVTMCIEKVESIAILNDIDIIYNPPPEIMISCDYDKLVRACINILSNSLKYTNDYIDIKLVTQDDVASIIISDNGNGFDESKLEKLFLINTGETIDGNGIGLLIVSEIVKQHGGSVRAQNTLNGGAEVIIQLPL